MGTFVRDILRQRHRAGQRIGVGVGGEAVLHGFLAGKFAVGIGQFAQHVVADVAAPQDVSGHIGDQAPFDFHHRQPRIGGDDLDVGPAGDLQAAAKAHPVDRRDHRDRQLAPDHRGLLGAIGVAVGAFGQRGFAGAVGLAHAGQIEPGTERAARARQHHAPRRRLVEEIASGLEDCGEHLGIERVHLVGADQLDVGDPAIQGQFDAIAEIHSAASSISTISSPETHPSSSGFRQSNSGGASASGIRA